MTRRQIVSIWFPALAMDRWSRINPKQDRDIPFALVAEEQHGFVLKAVNAKAMQTGINVGTRLTDARAIYPELEVQDYDPENDAAFLKQLTLWAQRWGPWAAIDGADGILLDVTGVDHLFGGMEPLSNDIRSKFAALGVRTQFAIAPNIGAAWALARFGNRGQITNHTDLSYALHNKPVSALRLDDKTITLLNRLGLKTVGALADVPRTSLARRFRKAKSPYTNPLLRLDQAFGRVAETVAPIIAEEPQRAFARVVEPILHVSILKPVLEKLAGELKDCLAKQHRGARRLVFEAFRIDGHVERLQSELAQPTQDVPHMVKLFADRLEKLDAGFGFDSFALTAVWHESVESMQTDLAGETIDHSALPHLIDRLSVRLGAQNVRRPVPTQSHIPERALKWVPALDTKSKPSQDSLPLYERPMRLLDRPEHISVIYATPEGVPRMFQWRQSSHNITKVTGPERIAPEWWREKSTVRLRDYYKVEDEQGGRFWIFRSGIAGDGRGGLPDWFMHGFFA